MQQGSGGRSPATFQSGRQRPIWISKPGRRSNVERKLLLLDSYTLFVRGQDWL